MTARLPRFCDAAITLAPEFERFAPLQSAGCAVNGSRDTHANLRANRDFSLTIKLHACPRLLRYVIGFGGFTFTRQSYHNALQKRLFLLANDSMPTSSFPDRVPEAPNPL